MPRAVRNIAILLVAAVVLWIGFWAALDRNPFDPINAKYNQPREGQTHVPTELPPAIVGQRVEWEGTAFSVQRVACLDRVGEFTPKSGNTYLLVEIKIENLSLDRVGYNYADLSFIDDVRNQYGPVRASPDLIPTPGLSIQDIGKGGQAEGNALFEVPNSLMGGTIIYRPRPEFGMGAVVIRVTWKR